MKVLLVVLVLVACGYGDIWAPTNSDVCWQFTDIRHHLCIYDIEYLQGTNREAYAQQNGNETMKDCQQYKANRHHLCRFFEDHLHTAEEKAYAEQMATKTVNDCDQYSSFRLFLCILMEDGVYNPEENKFDIDRIITEYYLDPDLRVETQVVQSCINEFSRGKETEGEKVLLMFVCFRRASKAKNKV